VGRLPIVVFAVGFLGGAFTELHHLGPVAFAVALTLASALRSPPAALRAGLLIATLLGIVDAWAFGHPSPPPSDGHIRREAAIVVDERPASDGLVNTTVRFADGTQGSAELPIPPEQIGARIVLRGKRVPFDGPRNPGEPSAREIASERGLSWRIARARVMSREPPELGDVGLYCARLRAWASRRVHERFPEPEATILAGAMWGERGALAPDLREEFQETGTVHVLVTAGLHLGVVAAASIALLQFVGCGRIGASLGAIAIVWLYAAISGDHLPSVRAATMLSFALLARAAGRESTSWNALAAAAIVVTAIGPASLTSVSFALSFSCVAAIFAFAKPIGEALESIGAPHLVREALAVAFATQLGTWPLTASAFLVIAPYAPLANALVVPIVGVAMLDGFVTLALAPIPTLSGIAANVETSFVDWIVAVVRFVASLPFAHVVATPPPPWTIVAYDGALVVAAIALHHGRTRRAIAIVVCASALCLWPPRIPNHELRIVAIDVGQADALLILTPTGHAYLVDAGGRLERGPQVAGASSSEEIGERIVVPFLIRSGIHHLDAVLLSHPHGDHSGGMAPVLRTLGADGFADSGQTYPGHAYHDALDVARERGIPLWEPRGGDVWRTNDGVTFRFYGPTSPYITGSRSDINSNSLVFRLEYGRFRMLFTGDAGAETEQRLLAGHDDLRADVLKVGHHGSAYGTTEAFLGAVAPSVAIISVGRDNLFGHPAPSTIDALRARGITTYRTDRDGAVTVTTDGNSYRDFSLLGDRRGSGEL
jgi:competence protein ComEC